MRNNEDDQAVKLLRSMTSVFAGGIISLGVSLLILFQCSIGISSGWLNNRAMLQYTVGSCVIGGFAGAMISVLRIRAKTLIVGFLTSCIQFLLIISVGFLVFPQVSLAEHGAGIGIGCLIGGIFAGFLGSKPKKKRRK